ncbi:VWA domain-containing protein [Methanohalophilus sp.]
MVVKIIPAIFLLFILALSVTPVTGQTLEISGPNALEAGEDAVIYANLSNNSTPLSGKVVNFSADVGQISANGTTNASGVATAIFNSTVAESANISATYGSISDNLTIDVEPAEVNLIDWSSSSQALVVGNISTINFTAYDTYGNINTTAPMDVEVSVIEYDDSIRNSSTHSISAYNYAEVNITADSIKYNYSTSVNPFATVLLNSTFASVVNLNVSSGTVSNMTNITYSPAIPSILEIDSYDEEYTVNTTENISVNVYDRYRNPVNNSTVIFNITPPINTSYNSPITYDSLEIHPNSTKTNIEGNANTSFRTDKRAGNNIINISVPENETLYKELSITGIADSAEDLHLTYSPSLRYANNVDYYRLSATPVDQFLNPILPNGPNIKEQVYFDGGSKKVPLNPFGNATTKVGPTPYVENISVEASFRNETGDTGISNSTTMSFVSGDLAQIKLFAMPSTILTKTLIGNHIASIKGIALDEWGHSLSDVNISLVNTNESMGNLTMEGINETNSINTTTNSQGRFSATFESKNLEGNCTINATSGDIKSSTIIDIRDSPFISALVNASPDTVDSGDIVNVTTTISVEGELPVTRQAATAMLTLDKSGSMDPDSYAGTPLDVVLVLDRSGSMSGTPLSDAKTAAKTFLDNLVSNSQVGLVSFSTSSTKDLDLTLLNSSDNKDLVKNKIEDNVANGWTAMGEALADANEYLIEDGRNSANKVVILLTDGKSNEGEDQDGFQAVKNANKNDTTIYTIGLGNNLDEAALQRIASETGGTYYNAPTSSDLQDVYNSIAQEISDYDVTDIEYGEEGFTPYTYTANNISLDTLNSEPPYYLYFEGWDLDYSGECVIEVNGNYLTDAGNDSNPNKEWVSFEYNITSLVEDGENTITFQDDHENYENEIRDINIYGNKVNLAKYPEESGDLTSYSCKFNTSYIGHQDSFLINHTLNDLKVSLRWINNSTDMDLYLESPSGTEYGNGADTTGYYPAKNSEYIWLYPLSESYPEDDNEIIEHGNWTVRVTSSFPDEEFDLETYIDKKSATRIASSAFLTSFNESQGDQVGLIHYSKESINSTANQSSYISNGSEWVGYLTVDSRSTCEFNLSWTDDSVMEMKLYEGVDLLNYTSSSSPPIGISSILEADTDYRLVIEKNSGDANDSAFTIYTNASQLPSEKAMLVYTDSYENVPRYRTWDGSSWSSKKSAGYVEGAITHLVLEASPSSNEFILGSLDENQDANFQRYEHEWGYVNEFSSDMNTYKRRGFDIAYEQNSGESVTAYIDDNSVNYRTWDKNNWSLEEYISSSTLGDGTLYWISLESAPDSDEIVMVTLDYSRDIRAQVWNGSSWGNSNVITNDSRAMSYQCYDVVYEQQSGDTIVVWSNRNDNTVHYKIWNGTTWSSEEDLYTFDDSQRVYWIRMAEDPGSDDILLAMSDLNNDVRVAHWNGSFWSDTQEIENSSPDYTIRSFDVAFESGSGEGMVVWSDDTAVPKYKTWNGTSWGSELEASNVSNNVRWVKLEPDPKSNSIFLVTSDDGGSSSPDINVQMWEDSSWTSPVEVATSSRSDYENFDVVFNNVDPEVKTPQLDWKLWSAELSSKLEYNKDHINTAIKKDSKGLTAIDEGMYVANNELENITGNSTMVLMTDGIDNAGSHSLLEQAQRARDQNTVIYTVGFGNSESEVDPVLEQIANITGGEYYFAPNSTVLEDIFVGIAADITNFSATGPRLELHIPHNYITNLSIATATYQDNSSNLTEGNKSTFVEPTYPSKGNSEPVIENRGDRDVLRWDLPPTMGMGDKWGVWYQLKVQGAGTVPLILPTSTLNYTDVNDTSIDISISYSGDTSIGGSGAFVDYVSLGDVTIKPQSDIINISENDPVTITARYSDGNPAIANVLLYTNMGGFGGSQYPYNITISGSDTVNFSSSTAGKAFIYSFASNGNNSVSDSAKIYVRPKGSITLN